MKVIVIGGGPAGMMSAISSAENGRRMEAKQIGEK